MYQEFIILAKNTMNLLWVCSNRGENLERTIAYLEELEKMDASEIYPRRINLKEVLIRSKDDEFVFPFADGTAKLSGRDYN